MIKEYIITVTHNDTLAEKDTFIALDLTRIESVRVSGDSDDQCVVDMQSGAGYVLHTEYDDLIKDWEDARNIKIIRLVSA
jgi:hypothetical protein